MHMRHEMIEAEVHLRLSRTLQHHVLRVFYSLGRNESWWEDGGGVGPHVLVWRRRPTVRPVLWYEVGGPWAFGDVSGWPLIILLKQVREESVVERWSVALVHGNVVRAQNIDEGSHNLDNLGLRGFPKERKKLGSKELMKKKGFRYCSGSHGGSITYVDEERSGEGDIEEVRLTGHGQCGIMCAIERKLIPP